MVRIAAALVHLFTALGSVAALMALIAITEREWEQAFIWLGVAFIIDGIDGTFARMVGVVEQLPRFSGERLDLVIDYLTYVFIPAYALLAAGYFPAPFGLALTAAILLSSLFHFSDVDSKAEDYSFVGFPAVWNIVAFYVFVFNVTPPLVAAVTVMCVVATFVPMKWVHPFRIAQTRVAVIACTIAWAVAAVAATWNGFDKSPAWSKGILGAVGAATVLLAIVSTWGKGRKVEADGESV